MTSEYHAPESATDGRRLRVVIEASLIPGEAGGVEQATEALVSALGKLTDGDEEFVVLTDARAPHWLDERLGPNTRAVSRPGKPQARRRAVKEAIRHVPPLFLALRAARRRLRPTGLLESHDPFVEALQPDVVHFPYQTFYPTSAPSLFGPHDLQHLHFPEFFPADVVRERQALYPAWCSRATAIEVAAAQVKNDLSERLGVPRSKIYVVHRPSPTQFAAEPNIATLTEVREQYRLPESFVYFPAQSWPHKNHLRLLQAVSSLRDSGRPLNLVLSGRQNEHWPEISAEIRRLGLEAQVTALGYIPGHHVRPLYRLAAFTVFPTLFEGGGIPAMEALTEGSPLTCSDLPVLKEQVCDAADLFDPHSVRSIADALLRLSSDNAYRDELSRRGKAIAQEVTWENAARTYRALYRNLANVPLGAADQALLRESGGDRPTRRGSAHSGGAKSRFGEAQ